MTDYRLKFKELYTANLYRMEQYAQSYLNDKEEARCVVQDAFIKIWKNREHIDWNGDPVYFMYTIVRNDCINVLRKQLTRRKYEKYSHYKDLEYNRDALYQNSSINLYEKEVLKLWKQAIQKMSPKVQETYLLSKQSQLKNREIAEISGITTSAVEARMTAAYRILRSVFKDYLPFLLWFSLIKTF